MAETPTLQCKWCGDNSRGCSCSKERRGEGVRPSTDPRPLGVVHPARPVPPPQPPSPPRITQRVLLVEDRETFGVGTGFLAATLRSMGYEVTEVVRAEAAPAIPDFQLLVLDLEATHG